MDMIERLYPVIFVMVKETKAEEIKKMCFISILVASI